MCPSGEVLKIAPDGMPVWLATTGNAQAGWPILSTTDVLHYGSYHASILSYSADSDRLWGTFNGYLFNFDPAIGTDGAIYGSILSRLISLSPIGRTNWTFFCQADPIGSPAIDPLGDIYFGTSAGRFYALRPDGSLKWWRQLGSRLNCSPAINRQGMIYVGDLSGTFYCFRPDGTTNWTLNIGPGSIESSPAIADDGIIYVGCGFRLVAIAATDPPAESPWPMYRHDARHTGRVSGARPQSALLAARRVPDSGNMVGELLGEANRAYTLLSSSNLQRWTTYTNLLGPTNRHVLEVDGVHGRRFLRAVVH